MNQSHLFLHVFGLGLFTILGLGGCNLVKNSDSTTKATPGDIFSNNENITAPKGTPKGLYPARTVQRCRYINSKKGLVTVRIGLPTERFAAEQRSVSEEKQILNDLGDPTKPWDGGVSRERNDQKYLLVEYTRDMCGISKVLKVQEKHSGFASMLTNYVPNFQDDTHAGETHCDLLSQGEISPSQIKPGQILQIPIKYGVTTSGISLSVPSIFMNFKLTSVESSILDALKAKIQQVCGGNKPRDTVRLKGHFQPFEFFDKSGKLTQGHQPNILYLWGQDLGKGMPVFQSTIVADSHDTSADHERPGLLVGFLKEIVTPVKLLKGVGVSDPAKDYRDAWNYNVGEKTEYYLTVGNSCF